MFYYALVALYFVISAAVTVSVLFQKKDVRSAIAWIGLVWLSPFIGAAIYYAFGINRVARRASKIKQNLNFDNKYKATAIFKKTKLKRHIAKIAQIGDQIAEFPIVDGNRLSLLRDGDQAYPKMLQAINDARHSVALGMYIFRQDHLGMKFVDALIAAHNRGVEIRVLVDGVGSGYFFSSVVHQLRRAGIKARRFMHHWLPWRMSFINLRNHKKLLIIDGAVGFVGGLNLGGENIWTKFRKRQVNDTHFCLEGPIVGQLMASFADDWHFTSGEELVSEIWWPTVKREGSVIARSVNSGPDEDLGNIETVLSIAISQAKHHIRIVTPYFLPDERLQSIIDMAMLRGVKIDLIIPARTDFVLVDWAVRGNLGFLKLGGIDCRLSPNPFDHSKLITVDGLWCAFGSPNWDVRSLRLNFEILIECYDLKTVGEIDQLIDEKIKNATPFTDEQLAARGRIVQLRDAGARLLLPYL